MVLKYIEYSCKNNALLSILTKNEKKMNVKVTQFTPEVVYYQFSNGNEGQIKVQNIQGCHLVDEKQEKELQFDIINKIFQKDMKEILQNFQNYYGEILDLLQQKEIPGTFEYDYYNEKKKIYQKIFEDIYQDKENLLFSYFSGHIQTSPNDSSMHSDTILLLQQSNLSQKKAILAGLNNHISIIEGPPGTGKTTTIINLIANLIYQNKKILIVSKNNSAIDNVAEELNKMNLPSFYLRLGNGDVMEELSPNLKEILLQFLQEIQNLKVTNHQNEILKLKDLLENLKLKEEKLNQLIKEKNELNEFNNQLRHVLKKNDAYHVEDYEKNLKFIKYRLNRLSWVKKHLDYLSKLLIKISDDEKINLFNRILSFLYFDQSINDLQNNGILLHLLLEEKYLNLLIDEKEKKLEQHNLEDLKKEIEKLYQDYIKLSNHVLNYIIQDRINLNLLIETIDLITKFDEKYEEMFKTQQNELSKEELEKWVKKQKREKIKKCKNNLLQLYPVILTTVDSVLSNYYDYFQNFQKIDYIIIDEASQCDILSALPLLYLAQNIVVVGDSKQLSAIINILPEEIKHKVKTEYDYISQTFLSTMSNSMHPVSNLLMEHYRCDYQIINYCNKYFYDNQLIIYKDSKEGAISFIDSDKGKYVEKENKSYCNRREIETISAQICHDISNHFIITPFKRQAELLASEYNKESCGTIHTFQGKGEKSVFFSTVLNETKDCIAHINSNHNLFTKELINVAVSRAKNQFILVTDTKFFKKYDSNMRDLIEYVEVYGNKIPDKTVCLFDYLYNQIPSYQITNNCDNIFEKTLRDYLLAYIKKHPEYRVEVKLPLAEVITDKQYLDNNTQIRDFILRDSHLDFTLYKNTIKKPVLAIELDGSYHKEKIQQERDLKKNLALEHMGIKLWRIKSTDSITEKAFYENLNDMLEI